jgi:hypothetical protein
MAKALCETRSELRSIDRQTTFKRIERLLQRGFVKGSSRVISGLLQRGFVKGSSRVISGPSAVLRESMREAIKEEFWEIWEIWEIWKIWEIWEIMEVHSAPEALRVARRARAPAATWSPPWQADAPFAPPRAPRRQSMPAR